MQVVPPGQGGVRDQAATMGAEWQRRGLDPALIELSREGAAVSSLAARVAACGFAADQPWVLVLHFSGYGYAARGLCGWLLDELANLRATHGSSLRLIVVFHELFASAPPWRTAFWLGPMQAAIAARLARLADALWTNTEGHARWLRSQVPAGTAIAVEPVFSNVGEPFDVKPLAARQPRAVVFGSAVTRRRALAGLDRQAATLRQLGVRELVEVGQGERVGDAGGGIACSFAGALPREELGALLMDSRFGLLEYPPQFLSKSSVFAAYAAHGCLVLDRCAAGPASDGLAAGRHYLAIGAGRHDDAGAVQTGPALQQVATLGASWYGGQRLARQAKLLLALARSCHRTAAVGG